MTTETEIRKYEKPLAPNLAGIAKGAFPSWLIKTDEPNLRSNPEALEELIGRECVITQKVDGSSATYYLREGEFGVCSRNIDLIEDKRNSFWRVADERGICEALAAAGGNLALQGEVYGEGIQDNHAGVKGTRFAAFNLFDIANYRFADHDQLRAFCEAAKLPMVTSIWTGEFHFTLPDLVELANAQEYAPGVPAEGIVIRPVHEARSATLGRLSAKVISERYALKHGE